MLERIVARHQNWRLLRLENNSGSPSRPRNVGVQAARGDYILFIDADDEVIPETAKEMISIAEAGGLDFVRSSLIVDNGHQRFVTNKITDFPVSGSKYEKTIAVLKYQSTTVSTLIRREMLIEYSIEWPENLRMGEDTIFLTTCIKFAEDFGYVDSPIQVYHKKPSSVASSTQQYGERELKNHLVVWQQMDKLLSPLQLSYFQLRGHIAIQNTLDSLIRHGKYDLTLSTFHRFQDYIQTNEKYVVAERLRPRLQELFFTALNETYEKFLIELKPRLLINGMDLKFISTAIPSLEKHYSVRVDQWTGHEAHDVQKSKQLLAWADIIWCEWMLGNAVWYSKNKKSHQKLIVRLHRFEISRDYGNQVSYDQIDSVICVSVHLVESAIAKFNIPRTKTLVVPNYLDIDNYTQASEEDESRLFNLAMIGMVPKLKGYYEALQLLNLLRRIDPRYTLTLFGKTPEELPWVLRDPAEEEYFQKCSKYIHIHNLSNAIERSGWVDIRKEIHRYGFVLSMSALESFHVAPAESFAAMNQAVFTRWEGVENIYPEKYIFNNIQETAHYILENRNLNTFKENCKEGRKCITENYSIDNFTENITSLINRL